MGTGVYELLSLPKTRSSSEAWHSSRVNLPLSLAPKAALFCPESVDDKKGLL